MCIAALLVVHWKNEVFFHVSSAWNHQDTNCPRQVLKMNVYYVKKKDGFPSYSSYMTWILVEHHFRKRIFLFCNMILGVFLKHWRDPQNIHLYEDLQSRGQKFIQIYEIYKPRSCELSLEVSFPLCTVLYGSLIIINLIMPKLMYQKAFGKHCI